MCFWVVFILYNSLNLKGSGKKGNFTIDWKSRMVLVSHFGSWAFLLFPLKKENILTESYSNLCCVIIFFFVVEIEKNA